MQQLTGQKNGNRLHVNISCFGILGTHPGIKVGVQYPLLTLNEGKSIKNLDQLLGAANLIFYYHRRNQIGTGFNVELGFRNRNINGLNKEVFLGVGYLRSFLPNATYFHQEFDDLLISDRIADITTPVLFITGRYDTNVSVLDAQNVFEKIGTAEDKKRLTILEESGHLPMLTEPEQLSKYILKFIKDIK